MANRTKVTPFAKFIIMLVIVSPLAYIGASYYNGEDGIQNIKEFFSKENKSVSVSSSLEDKSKEELIQTIELLKMKIDALEKRIEQLENTQ